MNTDKKLQIKLVIFTVIRGKLKIFLPEKVLPATVIVKEKPLDKIAKSLFEDTVCIPFKDYYFEQLYTFSQHKEVAIVYYLLLPHYLIPQKSMKEWYDGQKLSKTLIDFSIIKYAIQRLQWKIEYTNIVYSLLPKTFVFSQLQTVYEAILDKGLDKRNFRKKMLSLNILKPTGKMKRLGPSRPAEMFSFKMRQLTFVEIL